MGSPKRLEASPARSKGLALTAGPTAGRQAHCSNASVNVVVDSGASGHYFGDAIILRLWNRLDDYNVLDTPNLSQPPGGQN